MNDKEFLIGCWGVAIDCLKMAAYGAPDIGRINEVLIELRKRLTALGVDVNTLEQ